MSLAKLREQRRPVLPPLSPTADDSAPAPAKPPAERAPEPTPAPQPRPTAPVSPRPVVGGARLDSLLSSLIANAPQVAQEPPPRAAPSSEPAPASMTTTIAGPARRFPWRFVLGVAGAAAMAAVAVLGVRGLGARLASPGRMPDGTPYVRPPASTADAWIAAQVAAGERVL